jgi:hypothetical protein
LDGSISGRCVQEILDKVIALPPEEQLHLLRAIAASLRESLRPEDDKHSIMELKGLGKELWKGIDGQEYINKERESWD